MTEPALEQAGARVSIPAPLRLAAVVVIAALAVTIVGALHYYLIVRLAVDTTLPAPWPEVIGGAIVALGLSILGLPVGERLMAPPGSRVLTWPPSVWMGIAWLLIVLLAIGDLVGLLLPDTVAVARATAAVAVGLAAVLSGWGLREGLRMPRVNPVEVRLARWPAALDGFRIVQLSDLHFGPIRGRRFAARLAARVAEVPADLIAVTGDLVDGPVRRIGDEVAPLASLSAPRGVYFVTGNHDVMSGPRGWMTRAHELGWRVLDNEHVVLGDGDATFVLAGVHDHQAGLAFPDLAEDVDAALAGAPDRPVVLLAHDPLTFKNACGRVDLQISGHTHDGQIWPFGLLVRLVIPWVAGLYRDGESAIFVSRGTGFWGPPMRLGAPAEITLLTLRAPSAP